MTPSEVSAGSPSGLSADRGGEHAASLAAASSSAETGATPAASTGSLTIPDGELIILRFKPSLWMLVSRLWIAIFIGAMLAVNALARLGLVPPVTTRLPVVGWTLGQTLSRIGLVILVMCLGVAAWRFVEWWNAIYVLTDRRLVVQTGVLRQTIVDAPLRRIQHVSLHRDVEQRALSLGTLLFSTAGPFGEFSWYMISHPEQRLRIVRETIERYARNGHGV